MTLTELSIKRPTLIVVIFSVLGLLGIVSYFSIGYELLPKMSKQIITISTAYPGAAPSEVENSVTKKIEDAVSSLEKLDNIKSRSLEGQSSVIVTFKSTADINQAMQDAQRKVDGIAADLPEDAKDPEISKFSVDDAPIMKVSVAATTDSRKLYDIVDQRIVPALSKLDGVANVGIMGGEERELRVNIDRKKLEALGLDAQNVLQAVKSSNLDFPAGSVKNELNETTIRLAGKFKTSKDIEDVVITNRDGRAVYLKDVAVVIDGIKETETISRYNANTAIGLLMYKQTDANAVQVSEQVREATKKIEAEYAAEGLKFAIAQDSSEFTLDAAEAVNHDLVLAIILVALVMLVFLHSMRNAIIVMIAIPASLVTTFIGIYMFGFTFNLMTLLALSLVVGILVDDSIVVLENIQRHMEMGKDKRTAALDGRNEIGFTAMSITLVDVVVFLPITMVDGLVADILRQFSLVVVVSTLMSLFVCFTLTPLLVSRFGKLTHPSKKKLGGRIILYIEKKIENLTESYASLLKWSLGHKRWVLITTMVLLFGSFALVGAGFIGNEFVNMGDRGELVVKVELPKDATIAQTNRKTQEVEQYILSKPEVVNVFSNMGKSQNQFAAQGERHISEISVKLVDKSKRSISTEKFSQIIKKELQERTEGAQIKISNVDIMGSTSEAPIQLVLSGNNVDELLKYADTVLAKMKTVPGTSDQKISIENNKPEISVKIDKEKMMALGLRMDQVGNVINLAFSGNNDTKLSEGQYEYDIMVKLDAFNRQSVDELKQLAFVNAAGETISLGQFAHIERTIGPAKLERKDRISSVTVSCEVVGRPQGTVGKEIQALVDKDPLPTGVSIAYEGNMKDQADAFGSMGLALIASIIFVYLIMVALYNSYVYPFVVLFSIPVAIVGALLALALTMQTLNIFTLLGIIMLVGLVAKNAILLVDYTNQLKEKGYNVKDALLESGRTRLRPILMTTIAMVIGMLPLALASGAGAEWKNGMAWALIGGLTSSMLLTLVVVPVIYVIIDKIKDRFTKKQFTVAPVAKMACMVGIMLVVASLVPKLSGAQALQPAAASSTVQIAADPQYNKAGKLKRVFLGEHYRKEWATPVDVEVLNMEEEAGGLTPMKLGGGLQTKSLRLKGANGREYVLRSVRKDPSKAIMEELRGTFAEDIVQDQISSANPYAPLAVAALADAAGIFHSTPKLVYVPRTERLGEFENAFGESLCLLEERPSGNEKDNPAFGYSSDVVNSEKLFERVFSGKGYKVNEKAFLKARLFDMLIGDWDRHEDQWLWAGFKKDGVTTYYPIPRDRDQAFARMDGVIPTLASRKWALRKIKHFDYTIEDVNGLNMNGVHLDRSFTTRLKLQDWLDVTEELQRAMTDTLIDAAIKQMPAAIYNLSGKETAAKLKRRRDDLKTYATTYYQFLTQTVDIVGTNQKEIYEVKRIGGDSTRVTVYTANKKDIMYVRTFSAKETKEIRLYGLDGNDRFTVYNSTMTVRVIEKKEDYNRKSFKYDWLAPMINPGYNPDDGLYLGASVIYKKQQFGKTPYGYMQRLGANYASRTGSYSIWYEGIFKQVIGPWDLHINANFHTPSYTRNYYGLGNETKELDVEQKYYRVRMSQYELVGALERQFGKYHSLSVRGRYQAIKLENNEDRFVSKLDSTDFERKYYQSIEVNYQYNTLDNPLYPRSGVRFNAGAAYTQNLKEGATNFVQLTSDVSVYRTFGAFTLGTRTGVAANLNDEYEFFQANTLGNLNNLRGYRKDRYAGKTSVYSNTELRMRVGSMNAYMVQGSWGLLAFADHGRVWMPNEDSKKWHHGYGGGVWFLPFNRMAMAATYGAGKDDKLFSITGKFLF